MEETKWCLSLSPNLDRATSSSRTEAFDRVNWHPRGVHLSCYVAMQIQIRLPAEVGPSSDPLPPALAKISANETVIIELQGSIEIEGEKSGELIGNLDVTNIVRFSWIPCLLEVSWGVPFLQCGSNAR